MDPEWSCVGTEGALDQDVPSGSGKFLVTNSSAILDAFGLKPSGSCSFGSPENRSSQRNAESREKFFTCTTTPSTWGGYVWGVVTKGINIKNWCVEANKKSVWRWRNEYGCCSALLQNSGLVWLWNRTVGINTKRYLFHCLKVEKK